MRIGLLLLVALPLAAQDKKKPVAAEIPKPLFALPLTVAPGFQGKLTVRGLKLDDVAEVTTTAPRVKLKLLGKPRKSAPPKDFPADRAGDSEFDLEMDLPKDFPVGTLPLTVVGPKGKSEPFLLTIDDAPTVAEKEPNDGFAQAQELTLPAVVAAKIDRDRDVDVFKFAGKAGEKVLIEVRAARLGSPADMLITVYDADKRVLVTVDDTDGKPDPILTLTLPRDGTYYISAIEAHDLGGVIFAYRLHLTKPRTK